MTTIWLWILRVVGWRARLEYALRKALMPYADSKLPGIEAFVSKDILPKATTDALVAREVQNELDDLVRSFVARFCEDHPQAPITGITLLDSLSGVVEVRTIEEGEAVEDATEAPLPQRGMILSGSTFPKLVVGCGQDVVVGGPHAPEGVYRSEDPTLSARHARFRVTSNRCTVLDLGSLNHTFVNGEDIRNVETVLANNDSVTLGDLTLEVSLYAPGNNNAYIRRMAGGN